MEKIKMCRICLAQNVRLYDLVNKNLQDLYEKLTDITFVTEDSRPILACFICCAQLKKCYRFQKTCLEAEEQFAKMNEEYERKPLIYQDEFKLFHGLIRTPIDTISVVDVDQTESIVVKEELPEVCERLEDVIEPKEEYESDDGLKTFKIYKKCLPIEYEPPHNSESDSEDDAPLMKVKIKVEDDQEVFKGKRKYKKNNKTHFVKKTNIETRRSKHSYIISMKQIKSDSKMTQNTQNLITKSYSRRKGKVRSSINNTTVNINCRSFSKEEVSLVEDFTTFDSDFGPNIFNQIDSQINIDEKPYKCVKCNVGFKRKIGLTIHLRNHTVESFQCKVCKRNFSQKGHLYQHIRKYSSFDSKAHLNNHNLINPCDFFS